MVYSLFMVYHKEEINTRSKIRKVMAMDYYGFYTGKEFEAYKYLGAHFSDGATTFRVFAPQATKITVMGDFNNWHETELNRVYNGQFWEVIIDEASPGMVYKYKIYKCDGTVTEHCDPYGFGMELRPAWGSVIRDMNSYKFKDRKWMKNRSDCKDKPLNIYEMHMGSFRRRAGEEWYSYEKVSELLIPYLKENNYNYIEVMPISEHPCDESWGYQNTGFFAPTSRYGTAEQLKEFVDNCHRNGVGVILDFVPVHFAVDDYALAKFDGTCLYEYPHNSVGVSEWGSCNFIHSRGEVRSFLQSAANYWISEYHFDGLRMDAISRIIYWQGEENRGVNWQAVDFIKCMNAWLKEKYPSIILAAEDSTNFEKVTYSVADGGLGFDYKWDMGWMNDTLAYFKTAPEYRSENYHKLTFSMMYYYNENYLLPLSHDEVVHGKATIIQKMNGEYEEKFPQARAMYMYMYAHPGKKLNFMGNEIAQFREWDEKREQDWDILEYPLHDAFHNYMKELNEIYLNHSALSENDFEEQGFNWIDCHQEERCIYAFERISEDEKLIMVFNFSNQMQNGYKMNIGKNIKMELILNSEDEKFGGKDNRDIKEISADIDGNVILDMMPYSAVMYKINI